MDRCGSFQALGPDGSVGKGFHPGNLANHSAPDGFAYLADTLARSTLVPHLCGHIMLGGQAGKQPGFVHGMRKGLFAIDVFPHGKGLGSNYGVRMICGTHHNGIYLVAHFIEKLTEVFVFFCIGVCCKLVGGILPVHVAQSNDVF